MFCTRCGKENLEQAHFCFSCGNPLSAAQSAPIPPVASTAAPESQVVSRRPGIITLLAILQFIGAVPTILIALFCLGVGLFADTTDAGALLLGGILCGAFGALWAVCGFGLWNLKGYGRKIQLVFSWIGLIGFPVGTLISIVILVYLYKPGVKLLFAGKPASQFTPEEAAQVAALTQGSLGTVVAVAAIALVAIPLIGIIAAIAVPGLLRARMSGNEASAIGSLRAINNAQDRYAQKCSGYAPDLPELKRAGDFLAVDLTIAPVVTQSGYNIAIEPSATGLLVTNMPVGCVGSISEYFAHADPVDAGKTGTRYFGTDSRGIIFQNVTAPIANPIAATASPVR